MTLLPFGASLPGSDRVWQSLRWFDSVRNPMSFFDRMKKSPRARAALSQKLRARLQVEALESRIVPYTLSGNAWPHANLVTISFVPDGTNLGGVTSNLFAT